MAIFEPRTSQLILDARHAFHDICSDVLPDTVMKNTERRTMVVQASERNPFR